VIKGVVRAVIPEIQVIVLTHDEIPGFMSAGMTMASRSRTRSCSKGPRRRRGRFTLTGVPPDVQITASPRGQSSVF